MKTCSNSSSSSSLSLIYKSHRGWMQNRAAIAEPTIRERGACCSGSTQLEERVRVLERIVTDDRFDLKQQFKDLAR